MALLDSFYGDTPSYFGGLLGEDELKRLQGQAQSQSNLGMAAALLRAGAPSRTPGGGALAIAEGLQMGQQAYKQALNQGLQEKMQGMQVQDMLRKRQEEEQVRRFLPQIFQQGQPIQTAPAQLTMRGQPTMGVVRDDEGNMMPGGAEIPAQFAAGPTTINRDALQRLALAAPDQFAKYASGLKALQPEYKFENGIAYQIDPFGGGIKQVAGQAKEDLAGPVKQAMQVLGINKPFAQVTPEERTLIGQYIDRQETMKQPKNVIDLRDPTAVQTQQLKTINQWEGYVKDSGAAEVASRANGFYNAYNLAKKGNANADGALIYNVAKVYDPGGVVQAGDVSSVVGVRSVPDAIQNAAKKIVKGGTLLQSERDNLKKIIDGVVETRSKAIQPSLNTYRKINSDLKGDAGAIYNPFDLIEKPLTLDEILGK
jgi:hypothetical protein